MSDWMLTLSGPLAQRAPLLATLANAGVDVEQDHGPRGFDTDPTEGWIVARHADFNVPAELARGAGWALRSHWATPPCVACEGTAVNAADGGDCGNCAGTGRTEKRPEPVDLAAVVAQMQRDIAELRAKDGA